MPIEESVDYGDLQIQVVVTNPPWYENCYIVRHPASGEQIIFDPGGNADEILQVVKKNGGTVKEILLTHGHPDHIGAVGELQKALGVPCRAHIKEKRLLDEARNYAAALGINGAPMENYATFGDNADFTLGGLPFRAIATPGHTPGGVVYDFGEFAITGDTLFNHGVGRTDLPGGDGRSLVQSISKLLTMLAPKAALYCGHGPSWVADEARLWWSQMREWA